MEKMYHVWKRKECGKAEWEPAFINDIAEWLDEDYEVYLDKELTKSARDLDFGWMSITPEYIDACKNDNLFLPDLWEVVDSEDETTNVFEDPIHLSAEGRVMALQWLDDASVGYDLCYGRCKGLAGRYSRYEMWDLIKENESYHI